MHSQTTNSTQPTQWDVIVVGGGPAGLMAAGQAACLGARTLLLEKMSRPGRKLRITGKGRCNLTNTDPVGKFISHFGSNGKFLRQAFARFFNRELIEFLGSLSVATEVERGGRVFPASNQAQEVVDALVQWSRSQGVVIQPETPVAQLVVENDRMRGVVDQAGREYQAPHVLLATGGTSYRGTGSTGDGYELAGSVGHTVTPILPALVPLATAGPTAQRLQGLSLKNVSAHLYVDEKKEAEEFGEMLFTHFGLSGPIILTLSGRAVQALTNGRRIRLSIDLKPALDHKKLDLRLQRDLENHGKQHFQNLLKGLLPAKMIPVCMDAVGIPADKPAHQITAKERKRLRLWLKDLRFDIVAHRSFDEAIVTSGGVDLKEIDPKTMESRRIQGLYVIGELLDLDGDTGGYNLQAAFSTGWLAGRSAGQRDR
jgi:hypothetical protein